MGLTIALALIASVPAQTPSFSDEETCEAIYASTKCKGAFEGIAYSYMINAERLVTSGTIDGPLEKATYALYDPDSWSVRASRDEVEETVSWYAYHDLTGLMLALSPAGLIEGVCVVGADFPGRPIAVRVGSAPALKFSEQCSSRGAAALRSLLMKGGPLITRGTKWPYDYPQDRKGKADNFDKLLKLYAFLRRR